ncbi:RHS repeat-associated core domain-containing protein [Micromonospora sp. NPDC007208]|uniref:RHS repeat-associated core domain-containing protein n=1 Tax=Micromonospora sp. NPDC007208 TaxID=3364236 RepID=UPI00367A8BCD
MSTSGVVVVPAHAAPPQAAVKPASAPPSQPASPGSPEQRALGPSNAPVSQLDGPISVPIGTGPVRNGLFSTFQLTDRLTAQVNTGSGNLLIRSTDLVLPGIADNVVLGAAYNSLLTGSEVPAGSFGHSWRTRAGVDVRLIRADDGSVTYVAADGVIGRFTPSGSGYTAAKEFKATLSADGSGWKLVEHDSGRKLFFTSAGLLDRSQDRNDSVTDYSYDAGGRLTTVTSDRGATAVRTAKVLYGSNGYVSTVEQTGAGGQYRGVRYSYDGSGNLTQIRSATGTDTRFEYDSSRRVTRISGGIQGSALGNATTITYDAAHRVTSLTRAFKPENPSVGATTRWAYPSATQTLIADANTNQSQPVTSVPRSTYTVNADRRVTGLVDPDGKARSISYTPNLDVASTQSGTGGFTTISYEANGGQSPTLVVTPTGAKSSLDYANVATPANPTANFQPSSHSDTQGNTSLYTYNGAGNRLSATDALAAEAKVEYNTDGTIASSIDPGNGANKTTYQYDANKQLTSITPPTGTTLGVRRYSYDEFGRVRTTTDGAGRTVQHEYDLDDRVTRINYPDIPDVAYEYDGGGNVYARIDGNAYQNFFYDRLNRLTGRRTGSVGGLWYVYDPVGNLIEQQDERGSSYYTYNARNLLTKLVAANGTYTFGYDDEGRRTSTKLAVSSVTVAETVNTLDQSGRIGRTTSKRWQGGTASTVFDVSYCYAKRVGTAACSTAKADDTGLRQWQTDHHRGGAVSLYTYDRGNRLTKATDIDGRTYDYAYDSNGNRTSEKVNGATTQTLTYNAGNQITSSGYSHDGAGNQLGGSALRDFEYNSAGQLMRGFTAGGAELGWAYNGPDQIELGWKGTPRFEYEYFFGRNDQNGQSVVQSYTVPGTYGRHYVERDQLGTPLGFRGKTGSTFHHYFYVFDGLGSVVALIKYDGSLAGSYTYDPYGKVIRTVGSNNEIIDNAIGFASGTRHDDLTKFGRRWYDPNTGRFTQQDSLSFLADPASGNRYAYAAGNPVNYVDPTGLAPSLACAAALGASVAGALGTAALVAGAAAAAPVTLGASLGIAAAGIGALSASAAAVATCKS